MATKVRMIVTRHLGKRAPTKGGLQAKAIRSCFKSRVLQVKSPVLNGDRIGNARFRALIGAIGLSAVATHALAADPLEIGIGYLRHAGVKSTLSLVMQPADNNGLAGAELAIEDNNTTGKFLNQHYTLHDVRLKDGDDAVKAASALA